MRPARAAPPVLLGLVLLLGPVLLAGCYRAHGAAERDAGLGPVDAGIDAARDASARDASVDASRDAGTDGGPDAGVDAGRCADATTEPLLHLCSFESQGSLPAGEPATLSLFWSECVCAGERSCAVRVDGSTIDLDTWRCPETVECDDCSADLGCAIPPLAAGVYQVRVDGIPLATISAVSGPPIARPTCWDVQDDLEPRCAATPVALPVQELCHRPLEDVGTQVELTLVQSLPGCLAPAECRATLDGRRILLTATGLACSGDGGCGPSLERVARCITPPLRDGDYTIHVEGSAIESRLRIRDITGRGEVACVGAP